MHFETRKANFLNIETEEFPERSHARAVDIKRIMQFAYSMGWDVTSVDNNTGMIQFSKGEVKLNFYTTKFTLVVIEKGKQFSIKKLDRQMVKDLICKHSD